MHQTAALTHLCSVRQSLVSLKQTAASLSRSFGTESRAVVVGAKKGVQCAVILGCRAKQAAKASVSYIIQALWGWHSLWLKCTMGDGPFRYDILVARMETILLHEFPDSRSIVPRKKEIIDLSFDYWCVFLQNLIFFTVKDPKVEAIWLSTNSLSYIILDV